MTEELLQTAPVLLGRYVYYKLGATNLGTLSKEKVINAKIPPELALKKPDGLPRCRCAYLKLSIPCWLGHLDAQRPIS